MQVGRRSIFVEARLRGGDSATTTRSRPASDPDFSKGGLPQFLWVPRVEDDGQRGPNASKTSAKSNSAMSSIAKSSSVKSSAADLEGAANQVEGVEDAIKLPEGLHHGAPPEIEFQVPSRNS